MPALQSRKRRAVRDQSPDQRAILILTSSQQPEPEEDASSESPEPRTQRRRISNNNDGEEEDAYNSDPAPTQDPSTHDSIKKLIRLALAYEYTRRPLRRAEIGDKVLSAGQARQFKAVFAGAQEHLRRVFGMEMVELPARERVTVREKRAAGAAKSQGQQGKAATSWVLRSTLPPAFHDPAILPPPKAPTSEDEGMYTGIYTVLVSLISLSGGALPEAKMDRYLRRLGMEDQTPVTGYGKTELLLKRLEREGYLVKIKETATAGEEDVSWVIGPRGKVEVGDDGVRGLVGAVHGELGEEEEAELQRRVVRSLVVVERERQAAKEAAEKKKRGRRRKGDEEDEDEEDDEED